MEHGCCYAWVGGGVPQMRAATTLPEQAKGLRVNAMYTEPTAVVDGGRLVEAAAEPTAVSMMKRRVWLSIHEVSVVVD